MAHYCDKTKESNSDTRVCNGKNDRTGLTIESESPLTLHICPSTGGQLDITVSATETVQGLQRNVAKKLKVPRERITLLYRERVLKEGLLSNFDIQDGSRLTLIPNIESGLLSQKTEQGNVLQALEGLSENQVNDFLAGKSPLTLAMRLGDHMMFVQLQLSTSPAGCRGLPSSMGSRTRVTNRPSSSSQPSSSSIVSPHMMSSSPPPSPTSSSNGTPIPPSPGRFAATGSSHPRPIIPPSVVPQHPVLGNHTSLAEASKNLSQKLQELTKYHQPSTPAAPKGQHHPHSANSSKSMKDAPVVHNKSDKTQGAIIESMQHHGRGVYSGTFSGTLNPTLQDTAGRPRRNISTIVHILNDLLGATPQCYGVARRPTPRKLRPTVNHPSRSHNIAAPGSCSVTEEDKVTREKMEHLQSMLEQRRQRRKARREARTAPYAPWGSADKPVEQPVDSPTDSNPPVDLDANMESSNVASNVQDAESQSYTKLTQQTMVA